MILYHYDGSEDEFRYKLTPDEQELFREKMDAYSSQFAGMTLAEWREKHLAEEQEIAPRM